MTTNDVDGRLRLPRPNSLDPLGEPTLQRRIWAAYLQRGYSRSTFARALGTRIATVVSWDRGDTTPHLAQFARAAELLGYSMDDLMHGRHKPAVRSAEPALNREQILELLDHVTASTEARAAFGEHSASPSGTYQRFTRRYVLAFVSSYQAAVSAGNAHDKATELAVIEAVNARANADAAAMGARPVEPTRLAEVASEALDGSSTFRRLSSKPPPAPAPPPRKPPLRKAPRRAPR
jgi:transcriptional regulator with XRE-family HTH domain